MHFRTLQCHCLAWVVLCHRVCHCHSCMWALRGCKHWATQQWEAQNLNTSQPQESIFLKRPMKSASPQHPSLKPEQMRKSTSCLVAHCSPQLCISIFAIIVVKVKKTLSSAFGSLSHMQSWHSETLTCYLQTKQIWTRYHTRTKNSSIFRHFSEYNHPLKPL